MRDTLSRSTTTKSFCEYLVKTSTQKSTLGWIAAGRGNGSLVSDDALGTAASMTPIANVNAATELALRFVSSIPCKYFSPCARPLRALFPAARQEGRPYEMPVA